MFYETLNMKKKLLKASKAYFGSDYDSFKKKYLCELRELFAVLNKKTGLKVELDYNND